MNFFLFDQHAFKILGQIMDIPGVRGWKIIPNEEKQVVSFLFFYRAGKMEHVKNCSISYANFDSDFSDSDVLVNHLIDFYLELEREVLAV